MPFRLSAIRFSPSLWPSLAAFFAICLTLYLGNWQQGRAAEKHLLQAELESRAAAPPIVLGDEIRDPGQLRFARARAVGEWLASGQIFLDNKFDNESVGFHVITPLKIVGTQRYVLVNRGWVARGTSYPAPPFIPVPAGSVIADGVLTIPGNRFLELKQDTVQGSVWQNLTVERYRVASGLDILPLVLQAKASDKPLKPVTEAADVRIGKHVEYMLTWYSLAATIAALWLALNIKFERPDPQGISSAERNEP